MSRRLISNKTLWPLHVRQGRAEEISAWVAANGVDPDDVSTDHEIIVDDTARPAMLRYTIYLRTMDGAKYFDAGAPAVDGHAVPLVVLPPESWPVWALTDREEQP